MEDEFDKWRYSVGDIIISFGAIEFYSHTLFRKYCPDENVTPNFPKRAKTLTKELRSGSPRLKDPCQVADLLDKALELFIKRNHVAHNTVSLHLYQSLEDGEFAITQGSTMRKSITKVLAA